MFHFNFANIMGILLYQSFYYKFGIKNKNYYTQTYSNKICQNIVIIKGSVWKEDLNYFKKNTVQKNENS